MLVLCAHNLLTSCCAVVAVLYRLRDVFMCLLLSTVDNTMIVMLQPVASVICSLGTRLQVPVATVLCIQRQHHAQSGVIFRSQAGSCASNI